LHDVTAFSAGASHSLAVTSDGYLWAWGDNSSGQLGDGTTVAQQKPIAVMNDIADVFADENRSYAITNCGILWAWGDNGGGQLGDGTTTDSHILLAVLADVKSVSAGGGSVHAITADGELFAWGQFVSGHLRRDTVPEGHDITTYEKRLLPEKILDIHGFIPEHFILNGVWLRQFSAPAVRYTFYGDGVVLVSTMHQPYPEEASRIEEKKLYWKLDDSGRLIIGDDFYEFRIVHGISSSGAHNALLLNGYEHFRVPTGRENP